MRMKDTQSLITYYRERAPEYEQIYYRHKPERRKELSDEGRRLESIVVGRSVLDIACGTGYWTEIMSKNASSIVAVDISTEMIGEARKKSYRCPVQFVRCDLNHLPFTPCSFGFVTLGFWFSHQPREEYQSFFERLRAPLKAAGLLWMIDNNRPAEGPEADYVGSDEFGNSYKRRLLNNGKEFVILKNYFEEDELRGILSPYFCIRRLTYGKCYWAAVLSMGGDTLRGAKSLAPRNLW